ncbi:hypothetical protein [Actinoplanes sp. NBRC 103695]|uniref:hypothetical protein n=1 Tax=Actinoplanes sp. NBRC 103695 TaxID=3032202 RepID=UPI0024A08382|nr:hypothetical protein [Actinoplanes sp. NBRC 103695]GLY93571.1 hypothetical protein Acsp02_08270 [Actinoplanes sp. NBRC 103695]
MKLIAPAALIAVLLGTGVFFAAQGLDRADRLASVASLLLALAVAGVTLIAHLRRRQQPAREDATPPPAPVGSGNTNIINDAITVVTAPFTGTINVNAKKKKKP